MSSIQELKKNVEIKIKSLDLVVRENERILQRNKERSYKSISWYTRRDKKKYTI